MIDAEQHAVQVRNRLRYPPNAVYDEGIDLKRKKEPPKRTAVVIQIHAERVVAEPVHVEHKPQSAEIVLLPTEATIDAHIVYPRIAVIVQEVVSFYQMSMIDVLAHRRHMEVCLVRQIAMYLAKELTLRSLPEIGRQIGGRDHTTILHGVRKITALVQTDERLRDEIAVLKLRIADRVVAAVRTETPQDASCSSTPIPT